MHCESESTVCKIREHGFPHPGFFFYHLTLEGLHGEGLNHLGNKTLGGERDSGP